MSVAAVKVSQQTGYPQRMSESTIDSTYGKNVFISSVISFISQ